MTTTRRLAAIMAADVAGFSAAMERDEEGTLGTPSNPPGAPWFDPATIANHGRIVKATGDRMLVGFASAAVSTQA
jgi:adenylate cyclase